MEDALQNVMDIATRAAVAAGVVLVVVLLLVGFAAWTEQRRHGGHR